MTFRVGARARRRTAGPGGRAPRVGPQQTGAFLTALQSSFRRRAKAIHGLRRVADAHTAAVGFRQRGDGAQRLDPHRRTRRTPGKWLLAAAALAVAACTAEDAPPLPGYTPDPQVFAGSAAPDRVASVPEHPGLEAPVDLMVVVLEDGEPRARAGEIAGRVGGAIAGQVPDLGLYQLRLPTSTMAELGSAIAAVRAESGVAAAGYDFLARYRACPASSDVRELPRPGSCPWEDNGFIALTDIFEERGGDIPLSNVAVAIIDSGLNLFNGEFDRARVANVFAAGGSTEGLSDIDTDGGHGTQVAGVIAADDGDGGVNGIASRILGDRLQLLIGAYPDEDRDDDTAFEIVAATWLAIDAGAKIVNYSLGFGRFAATPTEEQVAVRRLFEELVRESPNVLFVAGAANEDWVLTESNDAPAGMRLPNVVTVGSSMPCEPGRRAPNSASGPLVDIVAQGEDIALVDFQLGRPVVVDSGTSFATPQVASAAAILWSVDPSLTAVEVRDYLLTYAALGPESTSGLSLDVATPVLQRLLENGSVLSEDLDPEEDGVTDSPGQVAARLCGGSTLSVEGFPTAEFYATDVAEGALIQGYFLSRGFGVTLQRPDLVSLSLLCEECAWDLTSFPIGDFEAGQVGGTATLGAAVGNTVSGSWRFDRCAVQDRYSPPLAEDDVPRTVLVESAASGVLEVDAEGIDGEPRSFEASLTVPFLLEPLTEDDPLVVAIESRCDGGRQR